ncbi:MAG: alternative ribosome rescue aminoacyl-tRNA hydrolase ArfB [Acidimicrobiia bacterium]|nr:alternative ribosome rescue aminoacyl-tRNA hydrolase ArfB [Acidimicrobiia bacterium]
MPFDIPESELTWRFDTSGGPGGQHANRSNTRVELTFDIQRSRVFDESTRTRIIDRIGPTVRIVEDQSRSQTMNRRRALERLQERLDRAAAPPAPRRRRTKPSPAVRERRLRMKRLRSEQKRQRRRPTIDE